MLQVSPFQLIQQMKLAHLFLQLDAFNKNGLIFRMCASTCLIGLRGSDCSPLTLSIKQIKLPFHSVALLITPAIYLMLITVLSAGSGSALTCT